MIVPDPIVDLISPALRAELQAFGRQGAANRAIVAFTCARCGRSGEGIAIKKHCSAVCRNRERQRTYRRRRAAAAR